VVDVFSTFGNAEKFLAEVDSLSERELGAVVDGVGGTPHVGLPRIGP